MNITTRALHLADAAVALAKVSTTRADDIKLYDEALTVIREARAGQSIVLNDPHPPHRLCECTACLEYWTPLPDCDAFAGGGKPIDHIAASGKMIAEPMKQERYFCERCGKRVGDKNGAWEGIHTCTPPADARDCGGAHHAE